MGANASEYTYTPLYIQHLKACSAYTDEYTTSVSTGDENSPYLKLKSTEEILGLINGKCYTKSTIYSYDLDKIIMTIKCGLSKVQQEEMITLLQKVNKEKSIKAKKKLQDGLVKFIEDNSTCRVKNYLEEEN